MSFILWRTHVYRPSNKALSKLIRVGLASAGMLAALLAARFFYPAFVGLLAEAPVVSAAAKEVAIVLVCAAGGALYPVLLFAFGGVTPAEFKAAMRRKKSDPPPSADLP